MLKLSVCRISLANFLLASTTLALIIAQIQNFIRITRVGGMRKLNSISKQSLKSIDGSMNGDRDFRITYEFKPIRAASQRTWDRIRTG